MGLDWFVFRDILLQDSLKQGCTGLCMAGFVGLRRLPPSDDRYVGQGDMSDYILEGRKPLQLDPPTAPFLKSHN
jgi:hypothetical protein